MLNRFIKDGFSIGHLNKSSTRNTPFFLRIDSVRWLDDQHFLAWTFPDDGIPDVYFSGLYFYSLDQGVDPIKIDNLLQDFSDPYGMESQVLILDE